MNYLIKKNHYIKINIIEFRWIIFANFLIILLALANTFPEHYTFSGGDVIQIFNQDWLRNDSLYLWSNQQGEGNFSAGSILYYPFYYLLFLFSKFFSLNPSQQSIFYYLYYWLGSYYGFLLGIYLTTGYNKDILGVAQNIFALIYALNPYTFYLFYFIWGFSPFASIYPIAPILFVATLKYFTNNNENDSIKILIILFFVFILSCISFGNLSFFISTNIVITLLSLIYFFQNNNPSLIIYLKKYLFFFIIESIACGWAIIPQLFFWLNESNIISNNNIFDFKSWIIWQRLEFKDLLYLNSYGLSGAKIQLISSLIGGIFIASIIAILINAGKEFPRKLRGIFLILMLVLLVIFILETKGKGILPIDFIVLIFSNPLLGALRSYGKLFIFIPFLLIYPLYLVSSQFKFSIKVLFTALFLNTISIYPLFLGQLQTISSIALKEGNNCTSSPNCNLNLIPQEYTEAAFAIDKDGLEGKILNAPYAVINSPGWTNYPRWKHIGADPTLQLFHLPVVQMNAFQAFGSPYGLEWSENGAGNATKILQIASDLGITYILFHLDVDKKFIQPALSYFNFLASRNHITKIFDGNTLIVYRINHLFRKKIISIEPFSNDNPQGLIFRKINPTKYSVFLPQKNEDIKLIFRQRYSPQWMLSPSIDKEFSLTRWVPNLFPQKDINIKHSLYGSYGNSWSFNPEELCRKNKCKENVINGHKYFEVLIEYQPQKLLLIILIFSILTTLIAISYYVLRFRKKGRMQQIDSSDLNRY